MSRAGSVASIRSQLTPKGKTASKWSKDIQTAGEIRNKKWDIKTADETRNKKRDIKMADETRNKKRDLRTADETRSKKRDLITNKEDHSESDDSDSDSDDCLRLQWVPPKTRNAKPPHPLTVTHVNQTYALQNLQDAVATDAEKQNSEEWLQTHSIAHRKLSLKDLVDKGKIGRLHPDQQTGKVTHQIQFDAYDINEFEYHLNIAIEMYTKRIKWLLQGSKRMFGHMTGKKVAVCIDISDASLSFGRQIAFQESLLHLIQEQLSAMTSIYLMGFGTDVHPLWPTMQDISYHTLEEAKLFVMNISSCGGTNLLKTVKHVMKLPDLDTVILILGSLPDQPAEILLDFSGQITAGSGVVIHAVAYDCNNGTANGTLKRLAESSGGRYHCYSASNEEQIYTSTDINRLLVEIREAQDIINKIQEMRQGLIGNAIISIMNEITTEVAKLPQARFLPRPPGHDFPLKIEIPKFYASTSQEWLQNRGLKAKQLNLYQVLAPNAYSYREDFVPVIKKAVQSQVHERAMIQFPWSDGSVKNLHVDMAQLFEYQKQLSDAVVLYEKRVDWLASGSRRIFGAVTERSVAILVDTSASNVNYLIHIQHSLRLLMQEQIANKDYFNIIAFGSTARQWMPTLVKPTPEHLQKAWRWVLELQCGGSRNFLSAYRLAVENDEEIKHHIYVQGVYLFTSGIPDQFPDVINNYIEESSSGRDVRLHTILFNVDDYDAHGAIPGRYANITNTAECLRNMAHISGGRFHWFRETGIIESDDIQLINAEIDKSLNFSNKCAVLVESVKKKYRDRFIHHPEMKALQCRSLMSLRHVNCLPQPEVPKPFRALPAPETHTDPPPKYLSFGSSSKQSEESLDKKPQKAILCRPTSATDKSKPSSEEPVLKSIKLHYRSSSARDPMQKVHSTFGRVSTQHFFLDDRKQGIGSVLKYAGQKSVRKEIPHINLPEQEDNMTTKEWMRVYSLKKLRLDLNTMMSSPDCKHEEKKVKVLHKNITAKVYTDVFPTVNIKGTMKYMQLLPHELNEYEVQLEKVLTRYLKRLQWLLSGSRRVFGTIVHRHVAILIDTSGSMETYMEELKRELASLVWEQLHKQNIKFNLISFSGSCVVWKDAVQTPSDANCHDAVRWISHMKAGGNTCTLEALRLAFSDPDIDAIYLLTDGKPDTSTSLVLREVARLNDSRNVTVNTISINCADSTANNFLKLLAGETGGRYHRIQADFDAQMFVHKLLSEGFSDCEYPHLPTFEGDDLRRLGTEIYQARRFLQQARTYKALYKAKAVQSTEKPNTSKGIVPLIVGRPRPVPPAFS
ncbi:hypothetical protein BsWGS_06467 [Bradybaena similaris]